MWKSGNNRTALGESTPVDGIESVNVIAYRNPEDESLENIEGSNRVNENSEKRRCGELQ